MIVLISQALKVEKIISTYKGLSDNEQRPLNPNTKSIFKNISELYKQETQQLSHSHRSNFVFKTI